MSKVGKGGKHAMTCEVCPDHLRHNMNIKVGQRITGTPRFIHDRASCRKKWERNKFTIMARWPENKLTESQLEETPVARVEQKKPGAKRSYVVFGKEQTFGVPARQAVSVELPMASLFEDKRGESVVVANKQQQDEYARTVEAMHGVEVVRPEATASVALNGDGSVDVQYTLNGEGPAMQKVTKHRWKPSDELTQFITDYINRHGYRTRSTAPELWSILNFTAKHLLIDKDGLEFHRDAFFNTVRIRATQMLDLHALAKNASAIGHDVKAQASGSAEQEKVIVAAQQANADLIEKLEALRSSHRECVDAAGGIIAGAWLLVSENKLEELKAILDLMRKE